MTRTLLIAATAVAALAAAGGAQAANSRHAAGAYAEPKAPIAYSELKAYMKASPKARASRDWSGQATTGAGVNAAAVTPAEPAAPQPSPDSAAGPNTAANPAAPATSAPNVNSSALPPANATPIPDTSVPPAAVTTTPAQ